MFRFLIYVVITLLQGTSSAFPSKIMVDFKPETKLTIWKIFMASRHREKRDGVGFYLGEPCISTCNSILYHVFCNKTTGRCECQRDYPVVVENRLCVKGASLGATCHYTESCLAFSPNSLCKNNICQCKTGYYEGSDKDGNPVCTASVTTGLSSGSDLSTMISVIAGLIMFTGLFCLVLRLFSKQRFDQPAAQEGAAANADILPRRASLGNNRKYSRASIGSNEQPGSRRASYGMLAPPPNAGSRRASSASVRSQTSLKSYTSFRSQSSFRSNRSTRDPVRRTASSPADSQTTHISDTSLILTRNSLNTKTVPPPPPKRASHTCEITIHDDKKRSVK